MTTCATVFSRQLLFALCSAAWCFISPLSASAQQQPTRPGWPQPMQNNLSYGRALLNQNEYRTANGSNTYRWEGEGWYGGNLNRAWVRTEGDLDTESGKFEEAETQLLFSRAITRYFDLQTGLRYDIEPSPSRGWAQLGVEGLAPLFWEIGAFGIVSDGGHAGARLEGSYDLRLTQRLVLQPQFELNFYTKSDARRRIGSGFSDLDSGLRLRFEIWREVAPYVGLTYETRYGRSADLAREEGASVEDLRLVLGIRAWF